MTTSAVKKQFETYMPLLNLKEQEMVLNMVKRILNVDETEKRITIKQYNRELKAAESRIAKGEFVSHNDVLKSIDKW
jgi:hypothetical protein